MAIAGFRMTDDWVADQRPKHWREGILRLQPNGNTPLFALTNLMKSKKVDDPEFNWWNKKLQERRVLLAEDLDAAETGVTVDAVNGQSALLFKKGDVFRSPQTDELFLVSADPSSATELTVVRGFAGSTAAVLDPITTPTKHPYLLCIGSIYPENSNAPKPTANDVTKDFNYTQIFRDTFGASRTAMKTRLRTGDDVKEAKRECLETHSMGIERALLFGRRWEGTIDGEIAHMTRGICTAIPADNIKTAGATTDADDFFTWMELMFRFGSNEKLAFGGSTAMFVVSEIVRKNTTWHISEGRVEYGMKMVSITSPFGELVLKNHPMFNLDRLTGAQAHGNSMAADLVVIDPANLEYRFIDDTTYQPKLQDNGLDGMQSGYLTECGLEQHHPETFFWIKGLKAAAKDA